jgi:hypothetical protein
VYSPVVISRSTVVNELDEDDSAEPIDELEVFEIIRHINDPEHPLTLEQLNVAAMDLIKVDNAHNSGTSPYLLLFFLMLQAQFTAQFPQST